MSTQQKMVEMFMNVMQQSVPDKPTLDNYPRLLRARLIIEEALEFAEACGLSAYYRDPVVSAGAVRKDNIDFETIKPMDWPEMIDAICDLLYVAYGAAASMGIDLDPFFKEVHRANMQKLTGPVREDGKRLKPPDWQPPKIVELLESVLTPITGEEPEDASSDDVVPL